MKRVVSSSIISVVILVLVASAFLYYQYYKSESSNVYDAVPSDVAWLISVDPTSGNLQQLARTGFFNGSDTVDILKEWHKSLLFFDSISVNNPTTKELFKINPLIVSGHVTGPGTFSTLFYIRINSANPDGQADKLVKGVLKTNAEIAIRNYNGVDIRELNYNNQVFSWTVSKGVFIGSFTSYLVEDAIRQQRSTKTASPATKLITFTNENSKSFLLAIRYFGFGKWVSTQINSNAGIKLDPLQRVGDWSVAKISLFTNRISFSGTTIVNDSTQFLSLFKDQKPINFKISSILSSRTAAAIIWGMDDANSFIDKLNSFQDINTESKKPSIQNQKLRNYFKGWIGQEIGLLVTQPIANGSDNHYFGAIKVLDETKCRKSLSELVKSFGEMDNLSSSEESYNGYTIRYIPVSNLLPNVFGSLFSNMTKCYYTIIEGYLITSNQVSALRGYINDIKTNNLLNQNPKFSSLLTTVPDKGNLSFYCNIAQSEKIFRSVAAPQWVNWLIKYNDQLKSWNALLLNVSNTNGIFNTNAVLSYYNSDVKGARQAWNTKIDTTIIAGPFVPSLESKLIFVQDKNLQCYAISEEGTIKWKKNLESKIKSEIFEVDYYKNGNHQYLFNTLSFIYIVDSLGNNVGNYPIRLPAAATNGLYLSKNLGNIDPSFYIACSNLRLYGYELSGKPKLGFSAVKLPDIVELPIWPSGSINMPYLTIADRNGTCFFLDYKGNRKFTLKQKLNILPGTIPFSSTDSSLLFNWFDQSGILMSAKGEGEPVELFKPMHDSLTSAITIDVNGDQIDDYILFSESNITATTIDGVVLFNFNIEGGNSINAQTINIGRKRFISYGLEDEKKVFLLNRDGTLFEGFPLNGIGMPISISNTELNFIIKSDSSSISLYQID